MTALRFAVLGLVLLVFVPYGSAAEDPQASVISANPVIDLPPQTNSFTVEVPVQTALDDMKAAPKTGISGPSVDTALKSLPDVCRDAFADHSGEPDETQAFWISVRAHCAAATPTMTLLPLAVQTSVVPLPSAAEIAAPSVTARVAAGFAQFVFTRAQTEVVVYVTTDFGVRLCTRAYKGYDVKSFFPDSCDVLTGHGGLYQQDVDVQQLGAALQAALQSDLVRLIPVLINSATANESAVVRALAAATLQLKPQGTTTPDVILDALSKLPIGCANVTPPPDADELRGCRAVELTVAAIKALRDAEKGGCTGTECLEQAIAKLKSDPAYTAWAERSDDRARHLVQQVTAFAEDVRRTYSSRPNQSRVDNLFTRVTLVRRAWQLVVETAIPEDKRGPHLELLRRFDQHYFRWHEVGLMIYRTVDALRRQRNPVEVIVAATEELTCNDVGDVRCGLQLAGIATQAITATLTADGKIDLPRAKEKFLEYVAGKKSLALDAWLAAFLKEKIGGNVPVTEYVTRVSEPLANVLDLIAEAREIRSANITPEQRRIQLTEVSVQLVDGCLGLWRAVLPDTVPSAELQRIANLVRHFTDVWKAADERDFPRLVASLYPLAADLGVREPIPAPLRPYVPLISGIASAKTSADYTAVLRAYAAPAGTWRDKRRQPFTVTLNSYLGGAFGIVDDPETTEAAVFLPVGVDLAWPKLRVFVIAADIGNVASLRSGDLEVPEKVGIGEIVSPGIFLHVPIGRSPFVVGVSAMNAPFLVPGEGGAPSVLKRGLRLSAVVAVDVPILTLFKRGDRSD